MNRNGMMRPPSLARRRSSHLSSIPSGDLPDPSALDSVNDLESPTAFDTETFLTHSEPVAPALALRSRMQEAFSVTHALAPPRQVPPGGAEGWRLQHGEHLLLRDAADNLVASLALDKPKRESHDEI